jgi:deferrochelatase/peroxidase EfeB
MSANSQPVLSPLTGAAIFLVVSVKPGGEPAVRDLLSDLAGLQRSVGFRIPEGRLTCVAGVGSAAWDRLFAGPRPAELHPFRELSGAKYNAVATPGDLLFHIRAKHHDLCFELATQIMNRLAGVICSASWTGPRTPPGRRPPRRSWSGTRTRRSPPAAISSPRNTCTTCARGTPCRPKSRSV